MSLETPLAIVRLYKMAQLVERQSVSPYSYSGVTFTLPGISTPPAGTITGIITAAGTVQSAANVPAQFGLTLVVEHLDQSGAVTADVLRTRVLVGSFAAPVMPGATSPAFTVNAGPPAQTLLNRDAIRAHVELDALAVINGTPAGQIVHDVAPYSYYVWPVIASISLSGTITITVTPSRLTPLRTAG